MIGGSVGVRFEFVRVQGLGFGERWFSRQI